MTLPSCLRSSIDHGFRDRFGGGRGGRWKKFPKLASSSALPMQIPRREMDGLLPLLLSPLLWIFLRRTRSAPSCQEGGGGVKRGGAHARVRARRRSGFLAESPHSGSGRCWSLSSSRVLPRTALSAGARRRPPAPPPLPPTWPGPGAPSPSLLRPPTRPLALSPDARARSLRTWRLSLPGPGQGPRILRPAPRAEGCDWNRRRSRAGRSGCRAGAAGPPRAPSCAHWVSRYPRAPGC